MVRLLISFTALTCLIWDIHPCNGPRSPISAQVWKSSLFLRWPVSSCSILYGPLWSLWTTYGHCSVSSPLSVPIVFVFCYFVVTWAFSLPCSWLSWMLLPALGLPAVLSFCHSLLSAPDRAAGPCWSLMCHVCMPFDLHAVPLKIVTIFMSLLLCCGTNFTLGTCLCVSLLFWMWREEWFFLNSQ